MSGGASGTTKVEGSASSSAVGTSPSKRPTSTTKDRKASEEAAAREAAAAAALALVPASAQPPSGADQTNVWHFTVTSAPFSLLVNANALVGVVLEYVRERSVKGVHAQLASRLARVKEDGARLTTEEATLARQRLIQLADLTAKQIQAQAALQRAVDAKAASEAEAAANGTSTGTTTPAPGATPGPGGRTLSDGTRRPDSATEERKDDGKAKEAAKGAKEKGAAASATATAAAKKKGGKGGAAEVEEPARTPEEEALYQTTLALESGGMSHAAKLALLARERDVLVLEERQLVQDLAWVKQLLIIGSVVPRPTTPTPPRPPSTSGGNKNNGNGSTLTSAAATGLVSPATAATAAPSPSGAATPASLKARRVKATSGGASDPAPSLPQSATLAPPGATFLGVDLWSEDRTPLNLRLRPLTYANTILKSQATYLLVAIYSHPGEPAPSDPSQAHHVLQIPIQFAPPTFDASTTGAGGLTRATSTTNIITPASVAPTAPSTPLK